MKYLLPVLAALFMSFILNAEEKTCRIGWASKEKDVKALVEKTHELGFNIIICHARDDYKYLRELCAEAQKENIDVYYWFHISTPKGMEQYTQIVSDEERITSDKIKNDKDPGRHHYQSGGEPVNEVEVHTTEFLCFHRPEVMKYSHEKIKKALDECPGLSGIAFDYIGYKNYKCCRCSVSEKLFEDYYNKHNEMPKEKALEQFSLDTMVDYNNRLADYVRFLRPDLKTACHIYPTFLANPVYGNRLDLDYCCQTVAWYFEPFWDLKKVADYTDKVTQDEKRYFTRPQGIPFVGIYMDKPGISKPAERFREELKTIRAQGTRSFSICPFNIFLKHPELGEILKEELDK